MAAWTTCFVGSSLQLESAYSLDGNSKKICDALIALNEGEAAKADVERLKAEIVNGDREIDRLRAELAKAKDEADAKVQALIDDIDQWKTSGTDNRKLNEVLNTHRTKPKFVWVEKKDIYNNTMHVCNDKHKVMCLLRDDTITWIFSGAPFDTADLAKAAVERWLTEGKR